MDKRNDSTFKGVSSVNNQNITNSYIQTLECASRVTKNAILQAIRSLKIPNGSNVIDLPCGIGLHMLWMLKENPNIHVTGLDINEDHIHFAYNLLKQHNFLHSGKLITKDLNQWNLSESIYDFVWCCDGLYAGSEENGCISREPYSLLNNMKRACKNKGTIAVLYWSGQKLLPGYPILEATLNATESSNLPFRKNSDPNLHYMRTSEWMKEIGLKNIKTRTFVADLSGPLDEQAKKDLNILLNMLWKSQAEVSHELWKTFETISNPKSPDYLFNLESYSGYVNYTMFTGEIAK